MAFLRDKHIEYITSLSERIDRSDSYEGAVTDHLRVSGVYWSVAGLSIISGWKEEESASPAEDAEEGSNLARRRISRLDDLMGLTKKFSLAPSVPPRPSVADFVFSCYDPATGGFAGNTGHDAHLLYTLSALQLLLLADALDDPRLDVSRVSAFVVGLWNAKDGSFSGDEWGEVDTRFSYCAASCLEILGRLGPRPGPNEDTARDGSGIDLSLAARYVASCQNLDGGYGSCPGAESHAGQIFCCVGALSILGRLDLVDADLLCWWLAERQCDSGGLNGRPEKQADVCYSWWVLSSLSILGKVDWIDRKALQKFILSAQDKEDGGIADRPNDMPDVYHTFFGMAGLSLLGYFEDIGLPQGEVQGNWHRRINPVFALPDDIIQKRGMYSQLI